MQPKGTIANKFKGAKLRSIGFAKELSAIAEAHSTYYLDAGEVTEASEVDGIHLDESQHQVLGESLAKHLVANILS